MAVILVTGGILAVAPPATGTEPSPAATESGSSDWRSIDVGGEHTCGVRTSGRLYCWGNDSFGQLGDGGTDTDQAIPVEVAGNRTDWASVSASGVAHTCALRRTGRLFCWGQDNLGQVGNGGTYANEDSPVQVAGNRTDWATVSAGGNHTCARRTTNRLFCWGDDDNGQLGDGGTNTERATPVQVAGNRTDWRAVAAGENHTCARRGTGRLFCWGEDNNGRLGNGGTNVSEDSPVQVAGNRTDWTVVAAGSGHTCARRGTGLLFCWGGDADGQVGDGDGDGDPGADEASPVAVAGGATDWVEVTAGRFHTCARTSVGRLYCWGDDARGQLGDGGANTSQPAPSEVFAP